MIVSSLGSPSNLQLIHANDGCQIGGLGGVAYKTTANVGCGEYTAIIDPDQRSCGIDPKFLLEGKELVPWDDEKAKKAIDEFCDGDFTVKTDKYEPGNTGFSQYGDETDGLPYKEYRWPVDSTDHITNIWVYFPDPEKEPSPDGCPEPKEFKISEVKEKCQKMLLQVLGTQDDCKDMQGRMGDKDTGGFVTERFGLLGCPRWQMFQYKI